MGHQEPGQGNEGAGAAFLREGKGFQSLPFETFSRYNPALQPLTNFSFECRGLIRIAFMLRRFCLLSGFIAQPVSWPFGRGSYFYHVIKLDRLPLPLCLVRGLHPVLAVDVLCPSLLSTLSCSLARLPRPRAPSLPHPPPSSLSRSACYTAKPHRLPFLFVNSLFS